MSENNNVVMEKEIRLTSKDQKYVIKVRMDFSNVSKSQLLTWSFQSQVIAMQRALRECSRESLTELVENGYECHALNAGTKPRTNAEVIAEAKSVVATLTDEQKAELLETLMS